MITLQAILMAAVLGAQPPHPPRPVSRDERMDHTSRDDILFEYLRPVLMASSEVARVYFEGVCDPARESSVAFPIIQVQPPSRVGTGVVAVREMLRDQPNARVDEGPDGIIRIEIGSVRRDLLRTRIPTLVLEPQARYARVPALLAIRHDETVETAARKLGMHDVSIDDPHFRPDPGAGDEAWPHLPPTLTDVAVDQALDEVATTFRGIVLYGSCSQEPRYSIDYEQLLR